MATAINTGGIRPVTLPPILAFIMGVPATPREAIERTIEQAIEALDLMDGDSDLEATFDEEDAALPCWWNGHGPSAGLGCPISDPGGGNVEDEGERDEY